MKKTLITIGIVLAFTLLFVFVFRFTGGAEELLAVDTTENESVTDSEAVIVEDGVSTSQESETAQNDNAPSEEDLDLKTYIKEKIVPVVAGVCAAVVTSCLALAPLARAISAIKNLIASFSKKDEERNQSVEKSNEIMRENIEKIENSVKNVPTLEKQIAEQSKTIETMAQVIVLGFSANTEIVRSGKGKKMTLLLNKLKKGDEE
ncbi:MAG: hypothetical protein E7602_06135 [Ruminococcaceae bacterium]|nr:hypothetical protein [Oscillospiraceae bacterium]